MPDPDREGAAPEGGQNTDVSSRLDAIANKLQRDHEELEAAMEQRRAAMERIARVHRDRIDANRRAAEGAEGPEADTPAS